MTEQNLEVVDGGCLCGTVRYKVHGPFHDMLHCHCSMCRKAHGAAFVTWVGVDQARINIEGGGLLSWYGSSSDSQRGFCNTCGATLFFRSQRWPGEIHVTRASIDSELDRGPSAHSYWDTHVHWVEYSDDLARK